MGRQLRRQSPALLIACTALFAALGGTVYAAAKLDGHRIKVKSLPGNRLAPGSLPANRLKPGAIPADRLLPESIAGAKIETATLGQVPTAVHADSADSARDAQTALNAVNAIDAQRVNGHGAGCGGQTRYFAGACWQVVSSEAAVSAPTAALSCATQGGELPEALLLAAFSQQPGVALTSGDEWSSDITNVSGPELFGVVTVSSSAVVNSAIYTAPHHYRCVIPLLS